MRSEALELTVVLADHLLGHGIASRLLLFTHVLPSAPTPRIAVPAALVHARLADAE